MSEFKVEVIKVGKIEKHTEADTLGITQVYGYPVIVKLGEISEGDLAAYVPIDSLVPVDHPEFEFLEPRAKKGKARIKAIRLCGIFSMGLLIKARKGWKAGQDVKDILGVEKYEPEKAMAFIGGDNEPDPGYMVYYDIESLRRYPHVFNERDDIVVHEKVDGTNSRFLYHSGDQRLYVASHSCYKKEDKNSLWWKVADTYSLGERIRCYPDLAFYGEIYGHGVPNGNKRMRYGMTFKDPYGIVIFDVMDIKTRRWIGYESFVGIVDSLELLRPPLIYRGPYYPEIKQMAEGGSLVEGADHVREGIVIKPVIERFSAELRGRAIIKLHGEGYLLQKDEARKKKKGSKP